MIIYGVPPLLFVESSAVLKKYKKRKLLFLFFEKKKPVCVCPAWLTHTPSDINLVLKWGGGEMWKYSKTWLGSRGVKTKTFRQRPLNDDHIPKTEKKTQQILTIIISVSLVQMKNKKTHTWRFTNFNIHKMFFWKKFLNVRSGSGQTSDWETKLFHPQLLFFLRGGALRAIFVFFSFPPLNTIKGGAHRKNKKMKHFYVFSKKSFTTYREKNIHVFFSFLKNF